MTAPALCVALAGLVVGGASASPDPTGSPNPTELVSVRDNGTQGSRISGRFAGPAINADGQVIAFDSVARLTPGAAGDDNKAADVFVHDRSTATTERVSVASDGTGADDSSSRPAIDGAGNVVAFDSFADNLVPADTNFALDVFAHDRSTDLTTRVSLSSRERQGNAQSHSPTISADGRFVAFVSTASNLVRNDDNGVEDIFVRDLVAGRTERVSLTSAGDEANSSSTLAAISGNGRWVAFNSFATNLVPGDNNRQFDVFLHDRATDLTERVSVRSNEVQANGSSTRPSLSHDGQQIAFLSNATNLVPGDTNDRTDVFVRDRTTGLTERASVSSDEAQADGTSQDPAVRGLTVSSPDLSGSGRFVAFFASATNLVAGDTNTCPPVFQTPGRCPDVFVRDRMAGTTTRINLTPGGGEANERSADPVLSENGRAVAFFSAAGNLVARDTNVCPVFTAFPGNCPDIFVTDWR